MILSFFEKMENVDSKMDAKINLRRLWNRFFGFFEPFSARLVQNQRVQICLKANFHTNMGVEKRKIFYGDFELIAKVGKAPSKKTTKGME
jgi:hypothetical protein